MSAFYRTLRGMKSGILRLCPLLFFVMTAAADSVAQGAAGLLEHTAAIAAAQDSAGRRSAITDSLKAAGIEYRLEQFSFTRFSGTNIVVDLPGENAEKTFLLGAHYDRVPVGQGAVDNAASCAVLLDLLAAFKSRPLRRFSIKAVFFDYEEGGLIGSQAYIASCADRWDRNRSVARTFRPATADPHDHPYTSGHNGKYFVHKTWKRRSLSSKEQSD